jgi:hypothetical protein
LHEADSISDSLPLALSKPDADATADSIVPSHKNENADIQLFLLTAFLLIFLYLTELIIHMLKKRKITRIRTFMNAFLLRKT